MPSGSWTISVITSRRACRSCATSSRGPSLGDRMPAQVSVLFTGFPGFIGARLLPRLLELSPGETFVCLVQDRFLDLARRELAAIEERYPAARGRLTTAVGDITRPGLALSDDDASRLRRDLTAA